MTPEDNRFYREKTMTTTPKDIELRDYFAARVLNGLLSNEEYATFTYERYATTAYEIADAMLKERIKK